MTNKISIFNIMIYYLRIEYLFLNMELKKVVYILKLDSDKYYVEYADNYEEKMTNNNLGNGAEWIKLYSTPVDLNKGIEIIERMEKLSESDLKTLNDNFLKNKDKWEQPQPSKSPQPLIIFKDGDEKLVNEITLAMMVLVGHNNVRGGSFTQTSDYEEKPTELTEFLNYTINEKKYDNEYYNEIMQMYDLIVDKKLIC